VEVLVVRFRHWIWIALVLAPPFSSHLMSQVDTTGNEKPLVIHARAQIPFKLYQNYLIVVQGSLGTLEGLNLLIDTGSNVTSIDRRIARKLGLKGQKHKLALLNQAARVERVVLPSLQVGSFRVESLLGLVQDLSFIDTTIGIRIDAVVGLDFLGHSSFAVDYESKKMLFGPIAAMSSAVPFKTGAPVVTVELRLNGMPVRLLVDTGTRNLLLFECQLPEGLRKLPTRVVRRSFNSAATSFETKEILVSRVQLGAVERGPLRALLTNDSAFFDQSFDGTLGPTGLGLKWIAFDFERDNFDWR
jgi:predicted aspartyl protease